MKAKIYTLSDPRDNVVKYIGKTTRDLSKRLSNHLQDSKKLNHRCANWIKSLRTINLFPIIELLEEVEVKDLNDSEIFWIEQFKVWGFKLKNETLGGDGASSGQVRTEEAKQKTSKTLKEGYLSGRIFFSDERKSKISNKLKNRIVSDKTKEKLRNINLNKKQSEDTKKLRYKKVYQYDKNLNLINVFLSVKEASLFVNGTKGNISNAVLGKNRMKSYKGYIWKYEKI